jgi:hypothetical protein
VCGAIRDDVLSDDSIRWMAHQTILDQDKLQADSDLGIIRDTLTQTKTQKRNVMNAIKAGIFTPSTRDELIRLEQEEADLEEKVKQAEKLVDDLPTEDDIISYLELFREGYDDKEFTSTSLLDAFVSRVEVHEKHILISFRIKKEDRQKIVDLPLQDECSSCTVKWTYENSKRTLYHVGDYFILRIAA